MTDSPAGLVEAGDEGSPLTISPTTVASWAVAIVVFVAAMLRQVGVPKPATMWAEDGTVFLQCVYERGALDCFGQPYQGYLHLVPRMIALAAGSVPPGVAPLVIAILASLTAAAAAAVAGRSIADATASPLAGVLGGVGLGLVWQAGREILGNAANIHWILFAATSIAIVCTWLGARITAGSVVLAAVAGLTSAFSPLLALLALGTVVVRRPRAWLLLVVSASAAAIQVLVELTSDRVAGSGDAVTVGALLTYLRSEVIRNGFFGPAPLPAGLLVPTLIVLSLIGIGVAVGDRGVGIKALVGVVCLVGIGLALCAVSLVLNRSVNPRYAFLPAAMMVAALALAGGYLATGLAGGSPRARQVGRYLMPATILLVGVGFALSFRLVSRASAGPDVPDEINAATATCPTGSSVTIPISPAVSSLDWSVEIPCARLVDR